MNNNNKQKVVRRIDFETSNNIVLRVDKRKSKRAGSVGFKIFAYVFLTFIAFCQVFPFYLKLIDSFQAPETIPNADILYLWPENFTLANYWTAMNVSGFWMALGYTICHTVCFTAISLFIAIIVAYTLTKLEFKGKKIVSGLLLATMMVPGEVLMIPNYIIALKMGINQNVFGLILPGIVNVFGIFLLKQYMQTIPNSVLESAEMDGCNELKKIFKIIVPMSKPVIITYVILTVVSTWNEYLWPLIMQSSGSPVQTLQLIMYKFYPGLGNYADGFVRSAGMILITIPIITVYGVFQKYFLSQNNIAGMK